MATKRPSYFWVQVNNGGKRMCIDAENKDAVQSRADEAGIGQVTVIGSLPYPSEPRLPIGTVGWGADDATPSFCYRPNQCLGRTCCPQSYSCTE